MISHGITLQGFAHRIARLLGVIPLPTVTLSANISRAEGNSGANVFSYTATSSVAAPNGGIQVPYSLTFGAMTADDFTGGVLPSASGNIAIAAGQTSGIINVSVNGDTTVEADEVFTLAITPPTGYAPGLRMAATGTVLNDDSVAPTPVNVLIVLGDSQSDGAANQISDLYTSPIDYTGTDSGVLTWDVTSQTIVTRPAAGSEPTAMQPWVSTTPVGWVREYTRQWRLANPNTPLYVFQYSKSGTGFSSSGAANSDWTKNRAGSLYNLALTEWNAFVSKLATQGRVPGARTLITDLGWNSAITAPTGRPADELATNFATDFATFITNVRADMLGAGNPVIVQRMQPDRTNTYVYANTIRAAQQAYVAGDATAKIVNADGVGCVSTGNGGNQHYTASGHIMLGRLTWWTAQGLAYPDSDLTNPVTAKYVPFDYQNTVASGVIGAMKDLANCANDFTGTGAERPALVNVNGYQAARFDGTAAVLKTTPFITAMSGGWTIAFVMSAAANATGYFIGEASTTTGVPLFTLSNSSGSLKMQYRGDNNTLYNPILAPNVFDGNKHLVIVTADASGNVTTYVDGNAGITITNAFVPSTISVNTLGIGGWGRLGSDSGFCAHDLYALHIMAGAKGATWRNAFRAYAQRVHGASLDPNVTLSADISRAEGNSGANVYSYTATSNIAAASGGVQVPYTINFGTLTDADFTGGTKPAASGFMTIAAGQTVSAPLAISINGDTTLESDETFTITITPPNGYIAGLKMSATGTVLNDDLAPISDIPPATTYTLNAASLATGVLDGRDGWVDNSGSAAKPTITNVGGTNYIDLGSAVGGSTIMRAPTYDHLRATWTATLDVNAGIGLWIGYSTTKGYYRAVYGRISATQFAVFALSYASPSDTNPANIGTAVIDVSTETNTFEVVAVPDTGKLQMSLNGTLIQDYTLGTASERQKLIGQIGLRNEYGANPGRRLLSAVHFEDETQVTNSGGTAAPLGAQGQTSLYLNGADMAPLTAAFAAPDQGLRSLVAFLGDSTDWGVGAGFGANNLGNARKYNQTAQFVRYMKAAGKAVSYKGICGTGNVSGFNESDVNPSAWAGSITAADGTSVNRFDYGGWTLNFDGTKAGGGYYNGGLNKTITFREYATEFEVVVSRTATCGLSWAVDGGAATTRAITTGNGYDRFIVPAGTAGLHALTLTAIDNGGTDPNQLRVVSITARNATVPAIDVVTIASSSSATVDLASMDVDGTQRNTLDYIKLLQPKVVRFNAGLNDARLNIDPATSAQKLGVIIDAVHSYGGFIMVRIPAPAFGQFANLAPYNTAFKAVCASKNVVCLSLFDYYGGTGISSLYYDGLCHPTMLGCQTFEGIEMRAWKALVPALFGGSAAGTNLAAYNVPPPVVFGAAAANAGDTGWITIATGLNIQTKVNFSGGVINFYWGYVDDQNYFHGNFVNTQYARFYCRRGGVDHDLGNQWVYDAPNTNPFEFKYEYRDDGSLAFYTNNADLKLFGVNTLKSWWESNGPQGDVYPDVRNTARVDNNAQYSGAWDSVTIGGLNPGLRIDTAVPSTAGAFRYDLAFHYVAATADYPMVQVEKQDGTVLLGPLPLVNVTQVGPGRGLGTTPPELAFTNLPANVRGSYVNFRVFMSKTPSISGTMGADYPEPLSIAISASARYDGSNVYSYRANLADHYRQIFGYPAGAVDSNGNPLNPNVKKSNTPALVDTNDWTIDSRVVHWCNLPADKTQYIHIRGDYTGGAPQFFHQSGSVNITSEGMVQVSSNHWKFKLDFDPTDRGQLHYGLVFPSASASNPVSNLDVREENVPLGAEWHPAWVALSAKYVGNPGRTVFRDLEWCDPQNAMSTPQDVDKSWNNRDLPGPSAFDPYARSAPWEYRISAAKARGADWMSPLPGFRDAEYYRQLVLTQVVPNFLQGNPTWTWYPQLMDENTFNFPSHMWCGDLYVNGGYNGPWYPDGDRNPATSTLFTGFSLEPAVLGYCDELIRVFSVVKAALAEAGPQYRAQTVFTADLQDESIAGGDYQYRIFRTRLVDKGHDDLVDLYTRGCYLYPSFNGDFSKANMRDKLIQHSADRFLPIQAGMRAIRSGAYGFAAKRAGFYEINVDRAQLYGANPGLSDSVWVDFLTSPEGADAFYGWLMNAKTMLGGILPIWWETAIKDGWGIAQGPAAPNLMLNKIPLVLAS